MAISITSLKNSTRNRKLFWADIHFFIFITWWARAFVFVFHFFVLVLNFTGEFIASVSSCPFSDYHCKIEVLSLITSQGNTVFLRPRNEIERATVISAASERRWLGQQSTCTMVHKRVSLLAHSGHFGLEDEIENS